VFATEGPRLPPCVAAGVPPTVHVLHSYSVDGVSHNLAFTDLHTAKTRETTTNK